MARGRSARAAGGRMSVVEVVAAALVVVAAVLLLGGERMQVQALFEDQVGEFDWKLERVGRVEQAVMAGGAGGGGAGGKKVFVAAGHALAALNARTGAVEWKTLLHVPEGAGVALQETEKEREVHKLLALPGDRRLLALTGAEVQAWDAQDGTLQWTAGLRTAAARTVGATGTQVDMLVPFAGGSSLAVLAGNALSLLSLSTGAAEWQWSADQIASELSLDADAGEALRLHRLVQGGRYFYAVGCVTARDRPEECQRAVAIAFSADRSNQQVHIAISDSINADSDHQVVSANLVPVVVPAPAAGATANHVALLADVPGTGTAWVVVMKPDHSFGDASFVSLPSTTHRNGNLASMAVQDGSWWSDGAVVQLEDEGAGLSSAPLAVAIHGETGEVSLEATSLPAPCASVQAKCLAVVHSPLANAKRTKSQEQTTAAVSVGGIAATRDAKTRVLTDLHSTFHVAAAVSIATELQASRLHRAFVFPFAKRDGSTGHRLLVVTKEGVLLMLQSGDLLWSRDESLAAIEAVHFIDLPETSAALESSSEDEPQHPHHHFHAVPTLQERLEMQLDVTVASLQSLFDSLQKLEIPQSSRRSHHFGFSKLAVCLTRYDRLVALDLETGKTEWTALLPATASVAGAAGQPLRRMVVTRAKTTFTARAEIVVFTGNQATEVDALSGAVHGQSALRKNGALLDVVVTDQVDEDMRHIFLLVHDDSDNDVDGSGVGIALDVFPATTTAMKALQADQDAHPQRQRFVHRLDRYSTGALTSFQVTAAGGALRAEQRAAFVLPRGERVIEVAYPRADDVNNLPAHVTGDDSLLLKYMNPNVVAIASETTGGASSGAEDTLYVTLVDTVSCRILHRVGHANAGAPVHMSVVENWVVYTYWSRKAQRSELGVITLYEGMIGASELNPFTQPEMEQTFSSFSQALPIALHKSFVLPRSVTALGTTSTARGITAKNALVGLSSGQVVSVDRRIIDPRRPSADELNDAEKKEGLLPYNPFIPVRPLNIVNYYKSVEGLRSVHSTSSKLESTSLVLFVGQDVYFTRLSPSGSFDMLASDFNHPLLMLILVGLGAVVVVLQLLTRRKRLAAAWN